MTLHTRLSILYPQAECVLYTYFPYYGNACSLMHACMYALHSRVPKRE